MLIQTLLVVVGLLAIAYLGLGIRIWIKGKFPDTEVETNPNMRKLGIQCAKQEEWERYCKSHENAKGINMGCSGACGSCTSSHC